MASDNGACFGNPELRSATSSNSRAKHLEAILADFGIPEAGDTAARLLERFGSFLALANASAVELAGVIPTAEPLLAALAAALRIVTAGVRETAFRSLLDPTSRRLHDYLRLTLGHRREELLLGFFGSSDGKLVAQRTLAYGDGHSVVISPASILRSALEVGAPHILLVHNHPSGAVDPSRADKRAMVDLDARAAAIDCQIVDHLIVGRSEIYSMRRGIRL